MILRSRRPVKTRPALNGSVIDYEKTTPVENRLDLWEDWFGVDPVSRVSQRNAFRYIYISLSLSSFPLSRKYTIIRAKIRSMNNSNIYQAALRFKRSFTTIYNDACHCNNKNNRRRWSVSFHFLEARITVRVPKLSILIHPNHPQRCGRDSRARPNIIGERQ